MINEAFDFSYLLLNNYKSLFLNEEEVVILLTIDYYSKEGNSFITSDLLSIKMSLDIKKIDKLLAGLLTKGFISYENVDNKTITSLDPLKAKLIKCFQDSLEKEKRIIDDKRISENIENVEKEIIKVFKRELSQIEINKIKEWIICGYNVDSVLNAIKDASNESHFSLMLVEEYILKNLKREDIEKDGSTSISSKWNKSLEETIKIAKTPWLDKKDD